MYHPTRGGTRGGQAEFTWDQVKGDQHRENYLGHSVFAPTGRWQNNKDVNWYNKDKDGDDQVAAAEKRRKELMEVKMREEEEMNKRLGIKPGQNLPGASGSSSVGESLLRGSEHHSVSLSRASTGANRAPLDPSKSRWNSSKQEEDIVDESKISKEDRRAARKLAKIQVKEERRAERRRRREERGGRRGEWSSDDSEEDDLRHHRSDRRDDRLERHEKPSRGRGDHDGDDRRREARNREDMPLHRQDDKLSRRDGPDRLDNRHRLNDRRWSSRDDLDRGRREDSRHSRPHRDRSRSPGRSDIPDMQRRRRDRD